MQRSIVASKLLAKGPTMTSTAAPECSTVKHGDGNMVEVTPAGQQVLTRTADTKTGAGSLFGLVVAPTGNAIYYVDDGDNTLKVLH